MPTDASLTEDNLINSTYITEYRLIVELKLFLLEEVSGIYLMPKYENSHIWNGVFFVRTGLLKNGIFRFTLELDDDYPNATTAPIVRFQQKIPHPLISSETYLLDTTNAFTPWQKDNHIWELVKFIKFCFDNIEICFEMTTITNPEATEQFKNNFEGFFESIKDCVLESNERIYDQPADSCNDKHFLTFEPFDDDIHGAVLCELKNKSEVVDITSSIFGNSKQVNQQ